MKKALVLTVGTGEGIENAVHRSLTHHNPHFAVFIATRTSLSTLERRVNEKRLQELYPNKVVILDKGEDLSCTYFKMKEVIDGLLGDGYQSSEIHVDFTTGTKVMSSALASLALLYGLASLTYVSGRRDKQGRVISGSERILSIGPLEIQLDMELRRIPQFMRIYQYNASLQIIARVNQHAELFEDRERQRIETLEHLVKGFQSWDLFDHCSALRELEATKLPLGEHIDYLESLEREKKSYAKKMPELKGNVPTPTLLVDILANAERRAEEGNYDDGVARLYRSMEMVGQLALINGFELNPSDLDLERLKRIRSDLVDKYECRKNNKEKIQLGLYHCFELLCDLDPDSTIAKTYLSIKEDIKKYLLFRNNSILAHGFMPVDSDKYEAMKKLVIQMATSYVQELEERISYVMKLFKTSGLIHQRI